MAKEPFAVISLTRINAGEIKVGVKARSAATPKAKEKTDDDQVA